MSTKSDIDESDEVETDRVDDEKSREERQERLLALYEKMNEDEPLGKCKVITSGALLAIAIIAVSILSWAVISNLGQSLSAGLWVAYIIFVLFVGLLLIIVWSSVRSHYEVTLAWIDVWKKTEIEEIRRTARKRDDKTFLAMYEIKFQYELAKMKSCLEGRNTDKLGEADSEKNR